MEGDVDGDDDDDSEKLLDTLDGLLIAAIQETEQMRHAGLSVADLEAGCRPCGGEPTPTSRRTRKIA